MYYFMLLISANNYHVMVWMHWSVVCNIHIHTGLCQTIIVHKALCNCYIAICTVHDIGISKRWKMRGNSKKSKKQWACLINKTILMEFDHSEMLLLINNFFCKVMTQNYLLVFPLMVKGWRCWCENYETHAEVRVYTTETSGPYLAESSIRSF